MRKTCLLLAVFLTGCTIRVGAPDYEPAPEAPPPPVATRSRPPASVRVLRVKTLEAGRIYAGVIHAKEVKARDGRVGRIYEGETSIWERERSDEKLEVDEVHADVIYAKEIRADWIEAREIHAKEVKLGKHRTRRDRRGD